MNPTASEKEEIDETKCFVALCYNNKLLGVSVYDELSNIIYADSISVSSVRHNIII